MDTLWRNLDGSVSVSTRIPQPGLPGDFLISHRPATEHELSTLPWAKPSHAPTNTFINPDGEEFEI